MGNLRSAVHCRDLGKTFRSATILRDIHLAVPQGSILGLVGPNGAGKTTLLKILATLVTPSSGDAFVCGRHVVKEADAVRRMIGYVSSEERSFFWRLRGRDNLLFFASLQGVTGRDAHRRIDRVLTEVGLTGMGSRRFHEYSTGMKQALGIARGMLHDPPVLLLDEPTRSLSPNVAREVRVLLRRQAETEGKTILISSHNLKEVEDLADQIAILHQGVLRAIGALAELKAEAGTASSADLDTLFEHYTGNS
jgi:ABC-2 type transport system ATP-binding protein